MANTSHTQSANSEIWGSCGQKIRRQPFHIFFSTWGGYKSSFALLEGWAHMWVFDQWGVFKWRGISPPICLPSPRVCGRVSPLWWGTWNAFFRDVRTTQNHTNAGGGHRGRLFCVYFQECEWANARRRSPPEEGSSFATGQGARGERKLNLGGGVSLAFLGIPYGKPEERPIQLAHNAANATRLGAQQAIGSGETVMPEKLPWSPRTIETFRPLGADQRVG